jgi:eukaryotic-like serine/threonine-protein kinase
MDREQTSQNGVLTTAIPAAGSRRSVPALFYTVAGLFALCFAVACVAGRGGRSLEPGWRARFVHDSYLVTEVSADNGALQKGDRLLTVAGDDVELYGPFLALASVPPGTTYQVQVMRGNQLLSVSLPMPVATPQWTRSIPTLIVAGLLYVLAAWIALIKFDSLTGRLAAANFFVESLFVLAAVPLEYPGWNRASNWLALILLSIWRPWPLAVGFDFISRFPHPLPQPAVFRYARWVFYACAAMLWIALNAHAVLQILGVKSVILAQALGVFQVDAESGALIMGGFEITSAVMSCAVLVHNYVYLPDPDSRRRIRWAGLSFASVIIVFLFYAATKTIASLTGNQTIDGLSSFANDIGTVVVGVSPLVLGYAVIKHRVLGIHVVFRLGLQYLFAKTVLQFVILFPLLIVLIELLTNPGRSITDLLVNSSWAFWFIVAASGAASLKYRRKMYAWLDRRFFRAAHDEEQILLALIERLKSAESEEEVALVVARDLDLAFQPDGLAILLRSSASESLHLAYANITDRAARIRDWLNTGSTGSLGTDSIFTLYESRGTGGEGKPDDLSYRQSLVIPLNGPTMNLGAFVLGEKRSEEPYGKRDRDLLKAIGAQMAMMYEFTQMRARVADAQRIRVDVLGRLDTKHIQLLSECPDCGRCYISSDERCSVDGAMLSLTLPVERIIEGKYRLNRRIGRGAMGVVYEATDTRLDRSVALKIMVSHLFGNIGAVARFEREARAAALLQHPNIVRVYDFGHLGTGGAYFVMELLRGRSWRQRLRDHGGIPPDQMAAWIMQLCAAVAAAHAAGIIHRDLKPENLMITGEEDPIGRVVVLDFGVAKMRAELSRLERDATIAGTVVGTRGYMSHEQRSGSAVDVRTDIYSVAVICAETITGARPLDTDVPNYWMEGALTRVLGAGSRLARVLERGASFHAADRYPSITAFQEELSHPLADFAGRAASDSPAAKTPDSDTLTFGPGTGSGE